MAIVSRNRFGRMLAGCGGFVLLAAAWCAGQSAAQPDPLPTLQDKASYAIGLQLGSNFTRQGLMLEDVKLEAMLQGLRDGLQGQRRALTPQQVDEVMAQFEQLLSTRIQQRMQALAEKNRKEGPAFLDRYRKTAGVQVTKSGLLYKPIKSGNGPSPTENDVVRTHYRGRLIDGTEFDSSYSRNEPAVFPVQGVIDGWSEALRMMRVGDRWQLVIPANLAYGSEGMPPVIPPDSVLIFEVELLGIEPIPNSNPAPNAKVGTP